MATATRKTETTTATIRDIARRAGVSIGTVSRVINGVTNIQPEIYERTLREIKACNYKPRGGWAVASAADGARTSRKGMRKSRARTGNIGVLFYDISQKWRQSKIYLDYITGVEGECAARDYHPVIEFMMSSQSLQQPRFLTEGKVDGVLIKANAVEPILVEKLSATCPVVFMDTYFPTLSYPQVAVNDHAAGVSTVEYLAGLGHKRIAFVNVQPSHHRFLARSRGYVEAMHLRGLFEPALLIEQDLFGPNFDAVKDPMPSLDPTVQRILDLDPRPTAVIFANDWAAHSSYECFHRRGVVVGRDISITGFDNMLPLCDLLSPPLTSYALPFKEAAEGATRELLERIDDHSPASQAAVPKVQLMMGRIVPRASVRPI